MSGILNLVSVGPGFADMIVPRAEVTLRESEVIVGYELYLRWIEPWIAGKEIHTPPLTQERERALLAIEKVRAGRTVALISSGDIGIYAMAALAFEEMGEDDTFEVNVVPGITSANACASLLGSPLSHDFATLSLSDLLCPWEWIESRARHIAQADLACVFYNVQSAGRQEGIYRILNIMLESKVPETLCGVVKNAYRPGQQLDIYRLDELPALKFDMLTSIIIGNRFTQRKRGFIFTPRGYNNWAAPEAKQEADLPADAAWVFSGTSDGNALAQALARQGAKVVISAATEYGREVAQAANSNITVWAGRQGVEARRQALSNSRARVLIDATHPYATVISDQLMGLSRELGIPYLRFERPSTLQAGDAELCDTMEAATERALSLGCRIFLATGSKDLAAFLQAPGAENAAWYARVTPDPEFIQRAVDLGLPRSRICAMQGPFSEAFNIALWRDWGIDCVVTKDSGDAGGFDAKAKATKALGIPLVVLRRPQLAYPVMVSAQEDALKQLKEWGIA